MKISCILEDGRFGGPHVYVINLINGLKHSNDVEILLPKNSSSILTDKLDNLEIQYKLLPLTYLTKQFIPLLKYFLFSFIEVINLAIYFRRNSIDIVYANGGSWQIKGVISAKLARKKIIWHLNDTYAPKVILWIFHKLSLFPDAYICASNATKEYYFPFIRSKKPIFVIPSPVDTAYFSNESTTSHEREMPAKNLTIGIVANINPIKGLDMFVRVAASLNNKYENLKFIVVGAVWPSQKSYYLKIKKMKDQLNIDNMEFVGQIDDTRQYLKHFDLYLCTSNFESSPISVWEAMSMGCAIVSTNVGDVSNYIMSDVSGEIVEVGDIDGMVEKVSFILKNPKIMDLYKTNCEAIANKEFDIQICVKRHIEVIQLLSKS